jgi:hypothetical protein
LEIDSISSICVLNGLAVLPSGVGGDCSHKSVENESACLVHLGVKVLGSVGVQGQQRGVLVLESELVHGLELLVVEAGVVAVLEASLLLYVITVT